MSSFPYKRAVVVGVTGSGKSTLAELLAKRFDMHYIRRRKEYPMLLAQPEHRHLELIQLRNLRETQSWLEGI